MHEHMLLKIYIIGNSARSAQTTERLKSILESHYKDCYRLEIIDLLTEPHRAEEDKILATPTVIKEFPAPTIKLVGEISDEKRILDALNFEPRGAESQR